MSEKREFVLCRGAQSTVSDSSFLCHGFMSLGSVLYLLFFFFPRSAGAQQCSERHLAGYACVVTRAGFIHPRSSFAHLSSNTDTCCPEEVHIWSWTAVHLWWPTAGWGAQAHPCRVGHNYTSFGGKSYQVGSLTRQHTFLVSVLGIST